MLVWLLRVTGIVMACALAFVFCPFEWMAAVHRRIGMGELAYAPLLSYLTRSLSALYAIVGSILLCVSFDPDRYRPLIVLLGATAIAGGIGVTVLDAAVRLPWFWTAGEGPLTVLLGVALLVLTLGATGARDTR